MWEYHQIISVYTLRYITYLPVGKPIKSRQGTCDDRLSVHTHAVNRHLTSLTSRIWLNVIHKAPLSAKQAASMHRQPWSPKKQLQRWEGAGLGPEPHSDGAFPWQWAAPRLNSPPLFMLFGGEAGFPPRDRWPFSHKVQCLDLACSGARQARALMTQHSANKSQMQRWWSQKAQRTGWPIERGTKWPEEQLGLQLNLPARGGRHNKGYQR